MLPRTDILTSNQNSDFRLNWRKYLREPAKLLTQCEELLIDKSYQLEIKCTGAQIDGVRPEEQYEILLQAKNVL